MNHTSAAQQNYHFWQRWHLALLCLYYSGIIIYLVLLPLQGWEWHKVNVITELLAAVDLPLIKQDIIHNLLLFIPFGLLLYWLQDRLNIYLRISITLIVAACFSFTLEILQIFLAPRTPSIIDLGLNTASAAIGIIIAMLIQLGGKLQALRHEFVFNAGIKALFATVAVCGWTLYELQPLQAEFNYQSIEFLSFNAKIFLQALFILSAATILLRLMFNPKYFAWLANSFIAVIILAKTLFISHNIAMGQLVAWGIILIATFSFSKRI